MEEFIESMRTLCADEDRLRDLGIGQLTPLDELVPAILATLDDLESGRLAFPIQVADR